MIYAAATVQVDNVNEEIFDSYFKLVQKVLDEHNILNH